MLRSKTACHAAIWHGEIRLDEIHLKAQDVQWLANSSIQSAIYKHQARGGINSDMLTEWSCWLFLKNIYPSIKWKLASSNNNNAFISLEGHWFSFSVCDPRGNNVEVWPICLWMVLQKDDRWIDSSWIRLIYIMIYMKTSRDREN